MLSIIRCAMTVQFFDLELESENPSDGMFVSDENELSLLLGGLRKRPPFVIRLVGTNGYEVGVGVGNPGFVQHLPSNGGPPCLVAVRWDAVSSSVASAQSPYRLACEEDDELGVVTPNVPRGWHADSDPNALLFAVRGSKGDSSIFLEDWRTKPRLRWDGI